MDYYFNQKLLIIKTNNREKFVKILENIGYDNVMFLNCSQLGLTELPDEICKLTNLISLKCSGNKLTKLPENIFDLDQLLILNISNNQFTEIPDVSKFKYFENLDISYNNISVIPESILNLPFLVKFNYIGNPIQTVF